MKSVAESGLATTSGAMRTMPEKWPGLSTAVRMEIAPPYGKRGRVVGVGTVVDPPGPEPLPWNRRPQMLGELDPRLLYYTCFPRVFQAQMFQGM